MVLLSCSNLHLWCISETIHGATLLDVAFPEHLNQEWLHHLFMLFDIITQFPLCVIDDLISQMPFLSLGQAICKHFLHKFVNTLAHLLQVLV